MKIFLAYGKNIKIKEKVQSIIASLGNTVVDLVEETNKGKTIIEKLELNSDVDKAVVLLTGDDSVKPFKCRKTIKCPRQNVIFELGYFVSKLKRENVIVIAENSNVSKLLSDYQVSYIDFSKKNAAAKLIKELKE